MVGYYDRILIGMAGSLLGGVVISFFTTISVLTGVFFGSALATLFMYDAMIRNPPLPREDPRVAFPSIAWHAVLAVLFFVIVID